MIKSHVFPNSSMLLGCCYDTDTKEMTVTFSNGKDYHYVDVDLLVFINLTEALSAGRYFNLIKHDLVQK